MLRVFTDEMLELQEKKSRHKQAAEDFSLQKAELIQQKSSLATLNS